MYNNKGSWAMQEEGQLNDMFEVVKAARPNKRATPPSSSGQTHEENLERYLFEKSGEIAVRDCSHTDFKSYFRPSISKELPWYMFLHRLGWGIASVQPFETGAVVYKGFLLGRSFS